MRRDILAAVAAFAVGAVMLVGRAYFDRDGVPRGSSPFRWRSPAPAWPYGGARRWSASRWAWRR
ncbi:hypothetical protein [Nonomuraea recticatena]|uniref:hypothetical protein n=1 Tax=Nonomuraea recticatena TaxID=46178 RepID=UPI003610C2B9